MERWSSDPDLEVGPAQPHHPPWPISPEPWFVFLVPLIFTLNVAVFIFTMYSNDCPATTGPHNCLLYPLLRRLSFQPLSENPVLGPSAYTLETLGALDRHLIVRRAQWTRLFSNIWLHAGVLHLLANMLSLLMVGLRLEEEFGFAKVGLLYTISGFGGSLMSAIYTKTSISVGASGALLGLLGAMVSELIANWTIYANKWSAISSLVAVSGLNLAVGFIPRVDNYAHTGGFLTGFLLGFYLLVRPQYGYLSRRYVPPGYDVRNQKAKYKCYQVVLWNSAIVVLAFGISVGLVKLYNDQ